MARNITFHLPVCAVHAGVEERRTASIAANALAQVRSTPLLARRSCECADAGWASGTPALAPQQRLSMRFVPPPPPAPLPFAAARAATGAPAALSFAHMFGPSLVLNTVDSALVGLAKIAPQPVADIALQWRPRHKPAVAPELRCEYADQYEVGDPELRGELSCWRRFLELLHGVLISNPVPARILDKGALVSKLLGPTGHYERFSAWSHVVGVVGFAGYAIARQVVAERRASVEGVFASVAAWATALVFLASSLYHCTAPDREFASYTRFVDYAAIYTGLVLGATADIAAATKGFDNVPVVTIIDIPIAGTLLVLFFVWRRARVPTEDTWTDDFAHPPAATPCSLGRGLFSRGHVDLHHSQLREATSLLLTAAYFMTVPAAVMTLGGETAAVVIALQGAGFVLLIAGMLLDKVLEWPNVQLVEGKQTCLACPKTCGCVLTSHGVWHVIALVSAVCTVVAREYAIHSY